MNKAFLLWSEAIHFTLSLSFFLTSLSRDGRSSVLRNCRGRQPCSLAPHQLCSPSDPFPRTLSDAGTEVFPASYARGVTPLLWAMDHRAGLVPTGLPRGQHLLCQFQGVDCERSERSRRSFVADQHDTGLLWIPPQLHLRHAGRLTGHVASVQHIHRDHVCAVGVAPRTDSCGWQAERQSGRVLADVWIDRERRCFHQDCFADFLP